MSRLMGALSQANTVVGTLTTSVGNVSKALNAGREIIAYERALGAASTASAVFSTASKGVQTAIRAVTAAIAANPLGLLLVALTSVVGALVLFRDEITPVQGDIATLGDYIGVLWDMVVSLGTGFVQLVQNLAAGFDGIQNRVLNVARLVVNSAATLLSGVINSVLNGVERMVNGGIDMLNRMIGLANTASASIPGYEGFELDTVGRIDFEEVDVGALVSGLAESVQGLGEIVVDVVSTPLQNFRDAANNRALQRQADEAAEAAAEAMAGQTAATEELTAAQDAQHRSVEALAEAQVALAVSTAELSEADRNAAEAVEARAAAIKGLTDEFNAPVNDFVEKISLLNQAYEEGSISAQNYWRSALGTDLGQQVSSVDSYLRGQGAQIGLTALQSGEIDGMPSPEETRMEAYNDMLTNPALASHGEEIEQLRMQYLERQQIIDQAYEAELISASEHRNRLKELDEASAGERTELLMGAYATQLSGASEMFGSLADIAKAGFGEQSGIYKAMFAASKAFAIAEAMVQMQVAISKALALPFPANIPMMAQAAASGVSIISNIQAIAGTGFFVGGYTGAGSVYDVAGVVHGQEYVLDHRATAAIGRGNLDYMNRHAAMPPANDRAANDAGAATIIDMRGSMVTRETVEDLKRVVGGLNQQVQVLDGSLESRVDRHRQNRAERGFY